jgi:tRNA (guanine-N7-)-methyltransferase
LPSALASANPADSPWTDPELRERRKELMERSNSRQRNKHNRFRQHVNPLASKYQCPTILPEDWPASSYTDLSKPLHLDIGCGKGGFLLDMAVSDAARSYNYLGLEIRPLVANYARERVAVHNINGRLDYIGCNANVDLRRILQRYHQKDQQQPSDDDVTDSSPRLLQLQRVSIQFPDPHYKSKRAKRRVVTSELVNTLAAAMPTGGIIFLQSDVQSMLDDMRFRFRESPVYFRDSLEDMTSYVPDNMMGVATERELSVLKQDLPVYRSVFTRSSEPYVTEDPEIL